MKYYQTLLGKKIVLFCFFIYIYIFVYIFEFINQNTTHSPIWPWHEFYQAKSMDAASLLLNRIL